MLRPSSLPRALAVVTAVVLGGFGPLLMGPALAGTHLAAAAGAEAPRDPSQPLRLHMGSITPDYIPDHGPIVIHGTVTNTSSEKWTAINVHGFIGSAPITTAAELAVAAQTPVTADVGHRITTPGTFDHVATLEPGQSARFTVRLPRFRLPVSAPGVYWFGVHALGTTAEGRSLGGRDRTFLPLIPQSLVATGGPVDAALVVPVRAEVTRDSTGAVEDLPGWLASLRSGPLHAPLALGRAAHGRPLTWLVDPAVPDTVRALAHGNPARTLTAPRETASGGPTPSASPSDGASAAGTGTAAAATPTSATGRMATRWLHRLHHLLASGSGEILGLPYGDLEVDSAARYDKPYLDAVIHRTGHTLRPWKIPLGGDVVAPPSDRLSTTVTTAIPRQTRVLLDDRGVTGTAPTVVNVNGRRVILASSGAAAGGPGPADPLGPLALRQRILSEAAIRLLDDRQPLVMELPTHWRHHVPTSFFSGLDVPWLRLTTLDGATAGVSSRLGADRLRAPASAAPSLGPEFFAVLNRVLTDARTLQSILPGNHVLRRHLFDEVAGNSSYAASADPFGALARMRSTSGWLTSNLAGVTLAAPESVTLTSTSGRFTAQVSNDLDVPVTVDVRGVADSRLKITGGDTIVLPPHGRTTVLLNASTHQPGVHTVTLELTNAAGTALASDDPFPIRAVQVSSLIWVIIGAGVALLFGAIFVRLVRRVLRSRA